MWLRRTAARAAFLLGCLTAAACNTTLDLGDFATAGDTSGADAGLGRDAPSGPPPGSAGDDAGDASPPPGADGSPDAPPDAPACEHVAPEDCTNGVDDDCNGLTDCEDPACAAFQCVPPVPSGWFGPVALWQAATGATTPACPPLYDPLVDARSGLSAAPAACACTCSPSGQACAAMGTFHPDQTCADAVCARIAPAPSGACTPLPASACGSGGSFDLTMMPSPSGGTCAPSVVTTVPPFDWAMSARVCFYAGALDAPGGCGGAAACLARPTSPYGGTLCVYSSDDPPPTQCPSGFDANPPVVVYSGEADTRGCGACVCDAPSGGACAGSVSIFADSACAASSATATYQVGTSCQAYSGVDVDRGAVKADIRVTAGACQVQAPPAPTGGAKPTLPTTVCCL